MAQVNERKQLAVIGGFQGYLVEVSCPICVPPPQPKLIFRKREGIGIWECPGCGILYASPRFDESSLLQIYENEAFLSDQSIYDNWSYDSWKQRGDRLWIVPNLKTQLVKQFLSHGDRVLDVGCGTGEFCLAAMENGLKCEGIDISEMLTKIARDILKVPVHQCDIGNYSPGYRFKGIIIWDVLEHLDDPVRVLKSCKRLLEPGGYLFAQAPNSKGMSNSLKSFLCHTGLKRNNYGHFGFPYHLYFFNKMSLTKLMKVAGLHAVHFESWSHLYKDGKHGLFSNHIISLVKRYCLSDYIIVVARRMQS